MKKILSIVAALSMAATMMSSLVVSAAINPTVNVDATVMTNDEFYAVAEMDIPEGYVMYNVTVDMSDFGELNRVKEGLKYSGRKLKVAQIDLLGLGEYADKDMTMVISNCFDQSVSEGFDGSKFTAAYASPSEATAYPTSAASGITVVDDVYSILVGVPSTEPFEIDFSYTYSITTYSKGTPGTAENGTVTGKASFGEVVPPQPPVEEKTVWTSADDASIPADKQIIADVANVTGITKDTRVTVSNGSEEKTFGNNIFAFLRESGLEIADDATVDAEIRFAILAPIDADADAFTFSVN